MMVMVMVMVMVMKKGDLAGAASARECESGRKSYLLGVVRWGQQREGAESERDRER